MMIKSHCRLVPTLNLYVNFSLMRNANSSSRLGSSLCVWQQSWSRLTKRFYPEARRLNRTEYWLWLYLRLPLHFFPTIRFLQNHVWARFRLHGMGNYYITMCTVHHKIWFCLFFLRQIFYMTLTCIVILNTISTRSSVIMKDAC